MNRKDKGVPNRVPEDMTHLTDKEKETLNNIMESPENSINLFHQLGFFELYLKNRIRKVLLHVPINILIYLESHIPMHLSAVTAAKTFGRRQVGWSQYFQSNMS